MSSKILDVYLHDIFAGELCQEQTGKLRFTYDATYVAQRHPALSLSLPLQTESFDEKPVKAFFSGLLPDSMARYQLARYLGVSEKNPFAMLKIIGVECAGAVSLHPQGTIPKPADDIIEVLDDQRLGDILELLKRRPLLSGQDGIRLSLAGAQDKMAVGMHEGKIALMKGSLPTTHILKPMIEGVEDSVHNEFFCMRLAGQLGIEVPHVDIQYTHNIPYYLIERYDRMQDAEGRVQRVHQEDFCQALAILPELKYENEGGPNLQECQDLLKNNAAQPGADQIKLVNRVIFNYLIGNADAHAKNFSLLYKKKKPELAPAYDLLCTAIYPAVSPKMAMKIGGKYKPEEVFMRHWHRIVPDTAVARSNLEKQITQMTSACLEKSQILKEALMHKGIKSPVFDQICEVIHRRSEHILFVKRFILD